VGRPDPPEGSGLRGWLDRPWLSADPGRLSWGLAALRGLGLEGPGRLLVSARPVRRSSRPSGVRPTSRSTGRSRPKALLALSRPFRDMSPQPRTAPPSPPAEAGARASRDASSPGLSCPTTHAGAVTPLEGSGSPRHRAPRPRFGYLLRDLPHRPPDAEAPERPWASPFKAFSSCARGAPLGVLALLTLPESLHRSRGNVSGPSRLQGFVPATSSCCHPATEVARPSMPSWASPLQSVLPPRPGYRF